MFKFTVTKCRKYQEQNENFSKKYISIKYNLAINFIVQNYKNFHEITKINNFYEKNMFTYSKL